MAHCHIRQLWLHVRYFPPGMYRDRCKEELMLRSMCQPLSERKRPALADLGAGFNRPCWGLEGTSAARDCSLAATARATKWEFAAGAGWRDGKWNYLPSSDKWMSLWEIEWILQPSLAQVQMWLMANSGFFLLLSLVFKSVKGVERSQEKKKEIYHVSSSTCVQNHTCRRQPFQKLRALFNWRRDY